MWKTRTATKSGPRKKWNLRVGARWRAGLEDTRAVSDGVVAKVRQPADVCRGTRAVTDDEPMKTTEGDEDADPVTRKESGWVALQLSLASSRARE